MKNEFFLAILNTNNKKRERKLPLIIVYSSILLLVGCSPAEPISSSD